MNDQVMVANDHDIMTVTINHPYARNAVNAADLAAWQESAYVR